MSEYDPFKRVEFETISQKDAEHLKGIPAPLKIIVPITIEKQMKIILPADTLNRKKIDDVWQDEYNAASKYLDVHLFVIEDLVNGDYEKILPTLKDSNLETIYYHGWMMTPKLYKILYDKLFARGYLLFNKPEAYEKCHHFNGWYPLVEDVSPLSKIVQADDLRGMTIETIKFMKETNSSLIIKDYVSSLKHYWHDACFIPQDAHPIQVAKVIGNFLKLKNDFNNFNEKLVLRKFVNLKSIGKHHKSGMPISQEYRSFVYKGKVITTDPYWENPGDVNTILPNELIKKIADRIYTATESNLFTVDTALLEDGSWICVEVGDGQVSSLTDLADKDNFYKQLAGK